MAGLSGTYDIPKVGKLPKVAVLGGVAGVIVLVIYEKRKQSSAASAPSPASGTAAAGQYPPDGTTGNPSDPYSTDPATGQTYGDESGYGGGGYATGLQNSAAYPWDGTYGNPSDPYSMDTGTGQTYGAEGYSGSVSSYGTTPAGPPFSTNAEWSQYVLNYFTTNQFGDVAGMTAAIGAYLAGQQVTAQQATYIQDAIAIAGSPPVAGASGFPPSIRQAGSQGGTVTVPDEKGKTAGTAHNDLVAAGLVPIADASQKPSDIVSSTNPSAGSHVQSGATVVITASPAPSGGGGSQVTVPPLHRGENAGSMHNAIAAAGLIPVAGNKQQASWIVKSISPPGGTRVARGSRVVINATGK